MYLVHVTPQPAGPSVLAAELPVNAGEMLFSVALPEERIERVDGGGGVQQPVLLVGETSTALNARSALTVTSEVPLP